LYKILDIGFSCAYYNNMPTIPQTTDVLGLPIHLSSDYPSWIVRRSSENLGTHIVTLNSEMAMLGQENKKISQIITQAELVIPDGSGVVLYLMLRGFKQKRVPGIELAQELIEKLAPKGPIAFYGGEPGVAEAAAKVWRDKIPDISILVSHGYLDQQQQEQWCQTLSKDQPSLVLVGLGIPRQEVWIAEHRQLSPKSVWIGVGGSFDIWSGSKKRAPRLLRDNNLEWLYRLYQEPWRWRRMLVLPAFLLRCFLG